jgi:hypothetical protein
MRAMLPSVESNNIYPYACTAREGSKTEHDLASDVRSYLDNHGKRLPTIKTILPAIRKSTAAAIRTRPESLIPTHFCANVAVSGQAAMPENKANQPFVKGSGPLVRRSNKPPPPATIAHTQAATQASCETNLREATVFFSGRFPFWSVRQVVMNGLRRISPEVLCVNC